MSKGLTGIPTLSYMGVNAKQPPNIRMEVRSPTTHDSKNFIIGDLWINTTPVPATLRQIWMLVALLGNSATWVMLYPGAGGGGGNLRSEDLLIEIVDPATGAINVYGTMAVGNPFTNTGTLLVDAFTLGVYLKNSIFQPVTNAAATTGMYALGASDFMHGFGTQNTMLGADSGNRTLDPVAAFDNTCIGAKALQSINTAHENTALGVGAASKLVGGSNVIAIGKDAATNLAGVESDSIIIGHPGVLGESNATHIGASGVGIGQQDKCFIGGIWAGTATGGIDNGIVICEEDDHITVFNTAGYAVLGTDHVGNVIEMVGTDGQIIIGKTGGVPIFTSLTSAGGSVTITPGPNTINLEAAGVAALTQLTTDTGAALPLAGNINVVGGELINTDNLVANTVTVNVNRGINGWVIAGNNLGSASSFKELTSHDGSIVYDFVSDPTKIDIIVAGVPPVGGITNLTADSGVPATPVLGAVNIKGGKNIYTVSAIGQVEINVTDNVSLLGWLHAADEIQTTGIGSSLISDHGHLLLPITDVGDFGGAIKFGGARWIHNYGSYNTFVGEGSGNLSLNTGTAISNTFIGGQCGQAISTGPYNVGLGHIALGQLTSGKENTCIGEASLAQATTSSYNTCLGWRSGFNAIGAGNDSNIYIGNVGAIESNTIRIGDNGVSALHQDKCYIAGIYGATAAPVPQMVVCGSNHKLFTQSIPAGGAASFVTDSGTATTSGTTIQIRGGLNIGTTGATNIVTVNLDKSVMQPATISGGAQGVYALGVAGSTAYDTYRFMHDYPINTNTYLGIQAGSITGAGGVNCTGIGYNALKLVAGGVNNVAVGKASMDAAITSNRCTAVGVDSGGSLTSGTDNVLIGYQAGLGAPYTTEDHNIILGGSGSIFGNEASVVGDDRVMRLGFNTQWTVSPPTEHDPFPVETRSTQGTDNTYIYGIYRNTTDYSGTPVYVDKTGKMGTQGGAMFAFRQTADATNATGDGTIYRIGAGAGASVTIDFDKTSSLKQLADYIYFEIPNSGLYCFTASITMSIPIAVRTASVDPLYVITSGKSFMYTNFLPAGGAAVQDVSEIVTTIVSLAAGDTVQWACAAGTAAQAKNISIVDNRSVVIGGSAYTCNATYFTGYRIS